MKKQILIIFTLILTCAAGAAAQSRADDEKAIRLLLENLAQAWTNADGQKFAEPFAEDADFVVWNGLYVKGRGEIAAGHERIFKTVYKDTKLQLAVRRMRFLSDAVAIVHTEASVVKKTEEFPKAPQVVPVFFLNRTAGGKWQIVAFQNTKVEPAPENKQ